ncbi:hypothetical protein POTOM_015427 [Populus tomentosa]|uniref:Uncharacterized protein n=1 Tax=Populus tomentosa TaxID=118781 RepID=A0A8X8D5Y9_POPTO|nr:hypothetical protein POTOM_015427 [Populus tomentosa]
MVWAAKHFYATKSAFSVLSVTDEQDMDTDSGSKDIAREGLSAAYKKEETRSASSPTCRISSTVEAPSPPNSGLLF